MTGMGRSSEGLDVRRRKVLFRCWHRGIREMDLIMGRFADEHIATLTDTELDAFEYIGEAPDPDILSWITGEIAVPAAYDTPMFQRLRAFHWTTADNK